MNLFLSTKKKKCTKISILNLNPLIDQLSSKTISDSPLVMTENILAYSKYKYNNYQDF